MDFKEQCCVVSETPGVTQGCVHARRDLSGFMRFGVLVELLRCHVEPTLRKRDRDMGVTRERSGEFASCRRTLG
jgi:hypothetical protein